MPPPASLLVWRVIAVGHMLVPAGVGLWRTAPPPEASQGMSSDTSGIIP